MLGLSEGGRYQLGGASSYVVSTHLSRHLQQEGRSSADCGPLVRNCLVGVHNANTLQEVQQVVAVQHLLVE